MAKNRNPKDFRMQLLKISGVVIVLLVTGFSSGAWSAVNRIFKQLDNKVDCRVYEADKKACETKMISFENILKSQSGALSINIKDQKILIEKLARITGYIEYNNINIRNRSCLDTGTEKSSE